MFAGNLLSFVPSHDVGNSDFVEASKKGEGSEDERRNNPLPLVKDLENASLVKASVSAQHSKYCSCN